MMVGIGLLALVFGCTNSTDPTTSAPAENGGQVVSTQTPSTSPVTTGGIEHANETNFNQLVLNSDVPVLVDFYADWCAPCKMIAPVLEQLARETTGAKIVKVNVDDNPQLATQYNVESIPYLLLFKDGQVVDQEVGVVDKSRLQQMLMK
jgi:thioredoxin 1